MSERQRYAPTSTGAPYRWHYLPGGAGRSTALCGEYRFTWRRLEDFARPDAFASCERCVNADNFREGLEARGFTIVPLPATPGPTTEGET